MYGARNPARIGLRSFSVRLATVSADGNVYVPSGSGVPKQAQSFSIICFIRGILLHAEMINEHIVSHGSWFRMRIVP